MAYWKEWREGCYWEHGVDVKGSVPRMACREKWRVVVARIVVGVGAEIWVKNVKGLIEFGDGKGGSFV